MTTFGKSIRIFLKDGTVTGIRFGEVVNQTIQSIACPRNRVTELRTYEEAKRPGVYFLFGNDETTGDTKAYIGEAENVFERLQNHLSTREFWNEVIFFVSKDENLTKSHVKYLESRTIQTDEGIVVLQGSEAAKEVTDSLQTGYRELRERLITNGTLILDGNKYIFQKNCLFAAASPAAAVIVGHNMSGPQTWKDSTGKTLKQIEEQKLLQTTE